MALIKLSPEFITPCSFPDSYSWKELYQQHRLRVKNAQSVIKTQTAVQNNNEPRLLNFLDLFELLALPSISGNNRTFSKGPEKRSHRAILSGSSPYPNPKKRTRKSKCKKLIRQRKTSRKPQFLLSPSETVEIDKPIDTTIPQRILHRFDHLCLPIQLMEQLLRPRVYLDLEIEKVRPLGRMVIQLFTEACPAVVLEFVRSCFFMHFLSFNIKRILNPLWIEGDICFEHSEGLMLPCVEHDMYVLDHGDGRGILSFPCHYLRGSRRCFVSFTISLKPLKVLNGRRVAFGVVTEGLWILEILQKYGSKTGKPLRKIKVTQCGIIG